MKKLLFPILFLLVACQSTECGDKAFQQEYMRSLSIVENVLKEYEQDPDTIRYAVYFLTAAVGKEPYEFDFKTCTFTSEKAIRQNMHDWYKWYDTHKCSTELKEVEIAMVRNGWK